MQTTLKRTQRNYIDIETNLKHGLYVDDAGKYYLIPDNDIKHVKSFYVCAFTSVIIKLNSKKVINLPAGFFYNLKPNEQITHKKFPGFAKFTKFN